MRDPDSPITDRPAAGTARTPDRRVAAAIAVAGVLLVALVTRIFDPFGWFDGEAETASSAAAGDVTLIRIRDAAELKVATGTFSVPVVTDAERSGLRERLPGFVDSEQIVAIYHGDVDATIDLRGLTEEGIDADPQARTITVRVPAPVLSRPSIDHEKSRIVSHQRGILQRLEDAAGEGSVTAREDLDAAAVQAIARAAEESDLEATARTNGEQFLRLLCEQMGYEQVTITYAEPAR